MTTTTEFVPLVGLPWRQPRLVCRECGRSPFADDVKLYKIGGLAWRCDDCRYGATKPFAKFGAAPMPGTWS